MSKKIENLLAEMRALADEAQAEMAKLERQNESAKNSEGVLAVYTPEFLLAETERINATLQAKIDPLREQAAEALIEAREQAEIAFYQARKAAEPQTPEGWQEAAGRAAFIREDLRQATDPADIVARYRLASDAGDQLAAWLIAREGLTYLATLEREADRLSDAGAARAAHDELNRLAFGETYQAHKKTLAELQNYELELKRPITPGEKTDYQKHIADAFGVKAELVPTE